jgi:hypothetical protein
MRALVVAASLSLALPAHADEVRLVLVNGEEVVGELVEETDRIYVLEFEDGTARVIEKALVRAVITDAPLAVPADDAPPALLGRRPRWGLGVNLAAGGRFQPATLLPWSPLGWEESALAAAGSPGGVALDAATLELRVYTRMPGRMHDIFFDVIDAIFLPAASGPGPNRLFAVSGGWLQHQRYSDRDITFAWGRGTGARIEGTSGQAVGVTIYAINRIGADFRLLDDRMDIGLYGRVELGVTLGANVGTTLGGLVEVVVKLNHLK